MPRHLFLLVSAVFLFVAACGPKPSGMPSPADPAEGTQQPGDGGAQNEVPDGPKPLPSVANVTALADENPDPAIVEVSLTAKVTTQTVAGQSLDMYTYNGLFPGPLLQARVGDRVIVHFKNELPEPTTIHWHGVRVPDAMDGSPRIQTPVQPGETFTYDFVVKDAGSFWYHPHVRANEQVEKGLYGPIIVRGENEPEIRERYLMVDDILLDGSGFPAFLDDGMEAMHGRFGNVLLTNGSQEGHDLSAVARVGDVERWRIVNTANARTMVLSLKNAEFRVVGTDGGPVPEPYFTDKLEVAIGQRYDLEVVYFEEGEATLQSWIPTVQSNNTVVDVPYDVFAVEVGTPAVEQKQVTWPTQAMPTRTEDETVTLQFDAVNDPQMGIMWRINGVSHPEDPLFTVAEKKTVRIKLKNLVGMEHPFHVHGQFFTVVEDSRPWTHQPGLKDVVLVPGNTTVDILAYMDNPGRWMAHCHILEHAELGMMAEFVVTPAP